MFVSSTPRVDELGWNLSGSAVELFVAAPAVASPFVRAPVVSRTRAGQSRPAGAAYLSHLYPLSLGPAFHAHGLRLVPLGTDAA